MGATQKASLFPIRPQIENVLTIIGPVGIRTK